MRALTVVVVCRTIGCRMGRGADGPNSAAGVVP